MQNSDELIDWCDVCNKPEDEYCALANISEYLHDFESVDIIPQTNREYIIEEVRSNLSCSYCPPNKRENANKGKSYYKACERKPKQRAEKSNLKQSRKFKKLQNKD